jgi:hypothetical protein
MLCEVYHRVTTGSGVGPRGRCQRGDPPTVRPHTPKRVLRGRGGLEVQMAGSSVVISATRHYVCAAAGE